jgi:hypothetical protein
MTLFEFLDLIFHLALDILDGLGDLASGSVGVFLCGLLARFLDLLRRVFRISTSLFDGSLRLVDDSLVGELFVADDFSDVLLDLSNSLVNFPSNLILIHGSSVSRLSAVTVR